MHRMLIALMLILPTMAHAGPEEMCPLLRDIAYTTMSQRSNGTSLEAALATTDNLKPLIRPLMRQIIRDAYSRRVPENTALAQHDWWTYALAVEANCIATLLK